MSQGLGIAVIGAGMAGRAHAAAYRTASTLYEPALPPLRLTAIADINPDFGTAAVRRFGYERYESDWQAVAAADDVDVVSVVVANSLHRPIVEGLLAAGKHVLCEKPLSDSDPDMAVNIEHEDVSLGRVEGIQVAAQVLLDAAAANHHSADT